MISKPVHQQALLLRQSWQQRWQTFTNDQVATNQLVDAIDSVRREIKQKLSELS